MNWAFPALRRRLRRRSTIIGAAVVVFILAVVVFAKVWNSAHPAGVLAFPDVMPAEVQRVNFTNWSDVRTELRVLRDDEITTMPAWLGKAFERDLSATSNMKDVGPSLQEHFGFSPANIQWEAYGQAPKGQVEVIRVNDTLDFAGIEAKLVAAGYPKPAAADGIWAGGVDRLAALDPSISAEFANIVLLPKQRLVLTSSSLSFLQKTIETVTGNEKSLKTVKTLTDMLDELGQPVAARVWVGDNACADLSMAKADEDSQTMADQAIAEAGPITPLVGFALALDDNGDLLAAAQLPTADDAKVDLKSRAVLAVGPTFNGTGSAFPDDLTLVASDAKKATVLLDFKPNHPGVFPLSMYFNGPLVFATC